MEEKILENLGIAVKEYKSADAENWARKAMEGGIDPVKAMDAMTVAIREVGDAFGAGELFLPELVGAAEAMQSATPVIEEAIKKAGAQRQSLGKVVAGTVFGDIHNIGKTMVCTLLIADGFEVIDLGINVETSKFVEAVKEHKPDILAMSALLTMTAQEQKFVIEALEKEGLRESVKIMVGGGALSEAFAESIGADGYDPTAPGAVSLAKKMLGI